MEPFADHQAAEKYMKDNSLRPTEHLSTRRGERINCVNTETGLPRTLRIARPKEENEDA